MIVLGIDTSDYTNNVGVIRDGEVLANFNFEARNDSLEKIVANIDYALQSARLYLEDIDGIGVGLGPGSWTGIRVGVTVGKMLAYSAGKAVCGISSLDAIAYQARQETSTVWVIISAGVKDAVYAALYHPYKGTIIRNGEYYVGDIHSLAGTLTGPLTVAGPDAARYCELIKQANPQQNKDIKELRALPHGSAVALLASGKLEKGEKDDVLSLTPLYLKESTARAYMKTYSGTEKAGKI
jgi:tRNA threonylcarbamoyladenosine biosynthesis protein TsaB